MAPSQLTPLQEKVLEAFFRREQRFFLTGGAALAGFHLRHRRTDDLDLFTADEPLDEGERSLEAVADELGAALEPVQRAPDFRRWTLRLDEQFVVVVLVRDRTPVVAEKLKFGAVRVDSPAEILANKLSTLMSRGEVRDLVDVYFLEKAGFRTEDAMPMALRKDASVTPAQLAWVISQIEIRGQDDQPIAMGRLDQGVPMPTRRALRVFLSELGSRLVRLTEPA